MKKSFLSDSETNFDVPHYTFKVFLSQKWRFSKKSTFSDEFTNPDQLTVLNLACFQSSEMYSGGLRETWNLFGLMKKSFLSDSEANFALPYYIRFLEHF